MNREILKIAKILEFKDERLELAKRIAHAYLTNGSEDLLDDIDLNDVIREWRQLAFDAGY